MMSSVYTAMLLTSLLLVLFDVTVALPSRAARAVVKQQDELLEEYDYIVAGGGTAGLTVADRLTESGEYTVLVIEYGYLDSSHSITAVATPDIQSGIEDEYPRGTRYYNMTSVPQEELNNRLQRGIAGCVVGGSSAVNGMIFDRGTAEDYDAWVEAAGDEHQDEFAREWGWNNLLPWFKKSVTFHPPTERMEAEYGITFDVDAAYGGSTPIHSSYAPFQWDTQQVMWDTFKSVPGIEFPKEAADGSAVGVFWFPNSIDPETRTRSYAKLGHYDNGPKLRDNFHLLPGHRVTKLILKEDDDDNLEAKGVVYVPRDGDMPEEPWVVKAKKEIILSAGAFHTPQILQRSGVGPRDVLEAAGVEVKEELPGVGWNFHDHMSYPMSFEFKKPMWPNSTTLLNNETFAAEAREIWDTNKTGPYSAYPNAGVFLPLSILSNRTEELISALDKQDPAEHLPQGLHPDLVAGYAEQKKVLVKQLVSNGSAVLEMPFSGSSSFVVVLLKVLSRGTVHLSPDDDGDARGDVEPVIDYRSFTNPIDLELNVEMLKWVRWFITGEAMTEAFAPVPVLPNLESSDDEEAIKDYLKSSISSTVAHPVGTAALAPRELGGVVGPDLTVYGVGKLSIADNSIITIVPGTHTSSTAYAIGEKASDLIFQRAG